LKIREKTHEKESNESSQTREQTSSYRIRLSDRKSSLIVQQKHINRSIIEKTESQDVKIVENSEEAKMFV
jgi:hypothetical protein